MKTPRDYQIKGAAEWNRMRRVLAKWDVGTGKTFTTLQAITTNPVWPVLILAPRTVMRSAWVEDAKHFDAISLGVYHGPKRAAVLKQRHNVVVTTHETFRRDRKKLETHGFRRFVVDESSKLKNHDSGISKEAMAFARKVESVILLTGTPASNGPHEYWAQMNCIDPSILGLYWSFINRYFVPVRRKIFVKGGQTRDVIERLDQTPAQRDALAARIAPYMHIMNKADCLTLPKVTDTIREVELGVEEWKAYQSAEKVLRVELESGEVEKLKMESLLGKLRQITGGAMYGSGGTVSIGSAKLDALDEVLDEIGPDEPVVVWAEYRHQIDRIAERIGAQIIDGRTKDAAPIVAGFQAGNIKRLVCHPQACGHGITLTRACYAVFYSLSFSAELWEQAKGRLDRFGQTRPVTNIHLIAEDTVDRVIYAALTKKVNVCRAVLEAIGGKIRSLDDACSVLDI